VKVKEDGPSRSSEGFPVTRWSLVLDVRSGDQSRRDDALGELCRVYWGPVYAFVRRSGNEADEAKDLTQGFFLDFLERSSFEGAHEQKGRMRNYLLGALKNFLAKSHHKLCAQKRGSGVLPVSLDACEAEGAFLAGVQLDESPELIYERKWAEALFERSFDRLRDFFESRGKVESFELLKPTLMGQRVEEGYAGIARQLGESESSIGVTVHRMRQRFRQLLEEEIRQTLAHEGDFQDELSHLYTIFQKTRVQV